MDEADAPDGVICNPPYIVCDGKCTDPMSDRENCGECGVRCEVPAYCNGGSCDCPTDLPGWKTCDGVCVYVYADPENCGDCGVECPRDQICDGTGTCASECSGGFTLCGSGSTAYCADLTSDMLNCGACGTRCPVVPHANPLCDHGECGMACDPGWVDQNGEPGDGCECLDMGDEICDGMDNDCNGEVDEGFECMFAMTEECVLAGTTCGGIRVCGDDCTWSACANEAWQCTPGNPARSCIVHGTCAGSQACRNDCTWSDECLNSAWNCNAPGISESCSLSSANQCPGSRTCQNCIWTVCREACEGAEPDCCPLTGCTNLASDPLNCGSCRHACGASEVCINRICTPLDSSTDVIVDTLDMLDMPDMPDTDMDVPDVESDTSDDTTPD
jgi:hypothetical protein